MDDRSQWQKEKYSRFWINRVKQYGFDSYCKGLCKMIEDKQPQSVYELAIGTGWPFAINFFQKGIQVSGSDISEILIEDVNRHYPQIRTSVGSYEELIPGQEKFDIVYCFRSTWYFKDIFKALDNMLSMAKKGGSVMFDIMNKDSVFVKNFILKHRFLLPYTFVKNIFKKIANVLLGRNYLMQDLWNIHEIPVSALDIESYLNKQGITFKKYSINQIEEGKDAEFTNGGRFNSKIVYDCEVK